MVVHSSIYLFHCLSSLTHSLPPSMASSSSRPQLPFRTRIHTTLITALTDAARRRDGTVNRRLLTLFDRPTAPSPTPHNGVATSDHTVIPDRNLGLRLYIPSAAAAARPELPLIVYFHGGGFAFHSAASGPFDALCRRLAGRLPALVASVDYRLAPEHRFPAAYDDGADALLWLDAASDLVPDGSPVFIAGDSAGGNIAHHVAKRSVGLGLRRLAVAGAVLVQPFFGGEAVTESEKRLAAVVPFGKLERFHWLWRAFLPAGASREHEAATGFGAGEEGEWSGFPATMVAVGWWDALQDHQRLFCERLKGIGVDVRVVEYPNAIHAFYLFPELKDATKLLDDVVEFVSSCVAGRTSGAQTVTSSV